MAIVVSRPIVDVNGNCLRTGKHVGKLELSDRTKKHMEASKKRFEEKEVNEKWEIHLEWIGRVKL